MHRFAFTCCVVLILLGCGDDTSGPALSVGERSTGITGTQGRDTASQAWSPIVAEESDSEPTFSATGFAPMEPEDSSEDGLGENAEVEGDEQHHQLQVELPTEWRGHWTSRFTTGSEECSACALGIQSDVNPCCQVSAPGPVWKIGDQGREMVVSFPDLVQSDMDDAPQFWPEIDYGCLGQGRGFLSVYWRCVDGSFDCADNGLHGQIQLGTRSCFYIERGYSGVFRPGSGQCGTPWNESVPGVDTLLVAWNEVEVVPDAHYRGVGAEHPFFCPNPSDVHTWIARSGSGDSYQVGQNVRTKVMLLKGGFTEAGGQCAASTDVFIGADTDHWTCK